MTLEERKLLWPDLLNIRELGGYETADGRTVDWRRLIRSSDLDRLTPVGQDALVKYGVRTIVDLRTPWEAENFPSPFSHQKPDGEQPYYQNKPLILDGNEAYESAEKSVKSYGEAYGLMLKYFPKQAAEVFRAIAHAEEGTILFYCHAGKDRTGIVSALLLTLLGVSREEVDADYADSAHYVQPLLDEWLERVGDDVEQQQRQREIWSAKPGTILALLTSIDKEYGSVEGYLLQAGVTQNEIHSIREKMLVSQR